MYVRVWVYCEQLSICFLSRSFMRSQTFLPLTECLWVPLIPDGDVKFNREEWKLTFH